MTELPTTSVIALRERQQSGDLSALEIVNAYITQVEAQEDKVQAFAWFDAEYGSATFLPMADGALFTIQLTNNGLIARPENDRAIIAIKEWE